MGRSENFEDKFANISKNTMNETFYLISIKIHSNFSLIFVIIKNYDFMKGIYYFWKNSSIRSAKPKIQEGNRWSKMPNPCRIKNEAYSFIPASPLALVVEGFMLIKVAIHSIFIAESTCCF